MHKLVVVLGTLLSILLVGCNVNNANKQANNIFDAKDITIETLKENNCLFYENLVFAEDDKNHVFIINGEKIENHYSYNKVEFNKNSFDSIHNKSIIEAVEYIGIPSFVGLSNEPSLDYSCTDGYIRRIKMSKNNNEFFINQVEVLDKEKLETWFDENKTNLPNLEQCQEIEVGMSIDEVVKRIGKPQRNIGYGARRFQFDIDDGSKLVINFFLDTEKENEYIQNHPEASVYGTHYLYVGIIEFVDNN